MSTAHTRYDRIAAGPSNAATSAGNPKMPEPTMLLNMENASTPAPITLLRAGAVCVGARFSNIVSCGFGFMVAARPNGTNGIGAWGTI